ncbi:MAG: methyltransferase domain-containing protein [Actinomycetia bacterium]|nr:methyltransferase domain-containing protein [Actinomycetes bacterium]MCP4226462.1 methyltransferase domain-containing protein [Actinomycetes bacterium]MCP5034712.1 methyltransferase domain-containing protein [Actinomycetes bacterium]
MSDVQADLRSYYEEEARLGLRLGRPPKGPRAEFLQEFLTLLEQEKRHSVLDFGAGPARDGQAFVDAGHPYVGLDLAHGNGILAAEAGISVIQGSIAAPPFRPGSFDAGWSMSTLMHIPEDDTAATLAAMATPLRPGAPLAVGLWGGELGEVNETNLAGHRRLFSLRPFASNQEILATCGSIERASLWDIGPAGWEYHTFVVRARR